MTNTIEALQAEANQMGSHKITLPVGTEPNAAQRTVYSK